MDGKTHKCIGLCSGIIASEIMISSNISTENIILGGMLVSGSILGSVLVDIDKSGTKISKKLPLLSKIIQIFTTHRGLTHWFPIWILIGLVLMNWINTMSDKTMIITTCIYSVCAIFYFVNEITKVLRKPFKKRNKWLKYIVAPILGGIMTYLIYIGGTTFMNTLLFCVLLGLLVGVASHLVLDSLTPMGIPLIGKKRIHFAKLDAKTAGPIIRILGIVLVIIFTLFWIVSIII